MDFQKQLLNFFSQNLHFDSDLSALFTAGVILFTLLISGILIYVVLKVFYSLYLKRILRKYTHNPIISAILEKYLVNSILKIFAATIVFIGAQSLEIKDAEWSYQVSQIIANTTLLYILFHILKSTFTTLDAITNWLKQGNYKQFYLVKSIFQVIKLLLTFLGIILGISILINKSPAILLTGLGALSAVLLLVFKDTIMGFTANIQVSAYDTVRIGDWVTMPSHGADGTVLDININVVTVQNFDKTIVSVPTGALISNSVKNWRGMFESGGRRIKRSIKLDISTIRFCDEELLQKLAKIDLLKNYINEYKGTPITNATLFREYITNYLVASPKIHNEGFLMLVRHLEPTEVGLPIEIYAFTNDTQWAVYEKIQANIFDHLFAIIPMFELRVFQLDDYKQRIR